MNDLYTREELLVHMKTPYNKGKITDPTVETEAVNAMCGDEITFQLKIEDGKIINAMFDGHACGVCTASASLLTEDLIDESVVKASKITKQDVLNNLQVNLSTSRIKCATLKFY
jgi:nitrogen fixation NifU-like protein